jgi:hypothetical protein
VYPKKSTPESPWLPLYKEKRPGSVVWLRANYAWLLSIMAVAVAGISAYSSLRNTIRSDARFRQEHRPWLLVKLASGIIDWQQGLYAPMPLVRNVGPGPALWFHGAGVRFDTPKPFATTLRQGPSTPTRMLPPGDSAYMKAALVPVDTSPRNDWPFYYHYIVCYGGIAQEETLFLEQVFYINTRRNPGETIPAALHAEQCSYIGHIQAGHVMLEGYPTPDTMMRARAVTALTEILQRLTPPLVVSGRRTTRADTISMLRAHIRTLRDSTSWAVCVGSLHQRGIRDDYIDYARAAKVLFLRTEIDSLSIAAAAGGTSEGIRRRE